MTGSTASARHRQCRAASPRSDHRADLAPALIGKDPLDHAVLLDTLLHTCVKLGPEGALTGALAALDIAMWDIKGKLFNQPIYKLLGGAWRTACRSTPRSAATAIAGWTMCCASSRLAGRTSRLQSRSASTIPVR